MPRRARLPRLQTIQGQPSWPLRSSRVRAWLTRLGGHLGPVEFILGSRRISPFSVAPWAEEEVPPGTPALLRVLRGDFFCAPFGSNERPWRGQRHPPHGETANAVWRLNSIGREGRRLLLRASLRPRARPGRVEKEVALIDGHAAIYQRHILSGFRGGLCAGHHPMLKFPEEPGSGLISTSRLVHAEVRPGAFEDPAKGGYQALRPGARFRSLERVPLQAGGWTDLSRFPARRGFEDLVMLTADPTLPFAWTAVAFPRQRYAWLALRSPRCLPHTLLWISNGGRHYPPWNGRHTAVMGLEDVASYYNAGLAASIGPNPINRRGWPTALALDPARPTEVRHVMALVSLPAGFRKVAEVRPARGGVELVSDNGCLSRAPLDLGFLGL